MKIFVDVMGGDNAPSALIKGAVLAARTYEDCTVAMIGREDAVLSCARAQHADLTLPNLELIHADGVITMEDAPMSVVREKKDSSMSVGLRLLHSGEGDAFVSAGNTGALHAGSTLIVRRIRGVRRPAIASVLPMERPTLLIDSGANIEVDEVQLCQFAVMGALYMKHMFGIESPAVGLLSNGTEACKGTPVLQKAHALLSDLPDIRFVGNVEAKQVPYGACDVLVTDGFSGNILLKAYEGMASYLMHQIKAQLTSDPITKVCAIPTAEKLKKLKTKMSASAYGGAPILGLNKPVIKAHGSSDATAVFNAIRQARTEVLSPLHDELAAAFSEAQQPS